jgi:beta-aspartyl-peptidase (threonine type)
MRARDEALAARNAAEMAAHGLPPEFGTEASAISPAEAGTRSETAPLRAATSDIEDVLRAQEIAWNAGDLEAFMSHYWKSDRITFSSGGRITRGWNATMARYRQRYPTAEKMGKVSFQDLEITPLGDGVAMVLGQWRVDREPEPLRGNFTLVVQRIGGRWLIVHDHTSRWEDPDSPTKRAEPPAKASERGDEI